MFEQNLKVLIRVNPLLGASLFSLNELKKFEVFADENDSLNINIVDKEDFTPLYNTKPIDEIELKLQEYKEYDRYPFLYFYGMGNGVFFKALLNNSTLTRVVIIEPNIELIYIALHFSDFTQEIESGRLLLSLSSDFELTSAIDIVSRRESKIFLKVYFLEITQSYYQKFHEDIIRINKIFAKAIEHTIYALGNDANDSLLGLQHHINNIEMMVSNPMLTSYINSAKNTELAIIVSTGPSLNKQLPLLKRIQNHITIFCVDASFPILVKNGIKPDSVISMERIFPTSKFFSSVDKEYFEDVIFNLTSIQHEAVVSNIKGGIKQFSMRPFGYNRYFNLDNWGYVGIGMSAANMAFELAYHSKFKTIVLIGQDLAYARDGSSHTSGHTFGINDVVQKESDLLLEGYGGGHTVKSTKVWSLFKTFFESDIKEAQERNIEVINATQGGARINGTIEMPFIEVIEKYIDTTIIKNKIILQLPPKNEIDENILKIRAKIKHILSYADLRLEEVKRVFLKVAKECETIEKNSFEIKKLNLKKVTKLITQIDNIKSHFNDNEFIQIFNDTMQAWIMNQELELAKIQVKHIESEDERKQKLQDWILAHRYWLFSVAGSIRATMDAIFYGINDELVPREYIEDLIRYYDGTLLDYDLRKISLKLKDRVYPLKDYEFDIQIDYLMNTLNSDKDIAQLLIKKLQKDYISKIRFRDDKKYSHKKDEILKLLNDYQVEIITKQLDKDKKSILIYIIDDIVNRDNQRVINSWMRRELDTIISHINKDKYNIILSIQTPEKFIPDVDGKMDFIPDIEKEYNPYMLGLAELSSYQFYDIVISIDTFRQDNNKLKIITEKSYKEELLLL